MTNFFTRVLDNYGPHHRFSIACFDDALSRAVADAPLHELLDAFLDSGAVLRPRHVKVLACRILHRNMTFNALHMMLQMSHQVRDRYRATITQLNQAKYPPIDHISQIGKLELVGFRSALASEIVYNTEWKERSRTIQLGTGHHGETFRIDKAPDDVVRFTNEATKLLHDIDGWIKVLTIKEEEKDSKPMKAPFNFKSVSLFCRLFILV